MQRLQLLVEKGAQAVELVLVAQILGGDDLVIGAGEDLVAEGLRVIEDGGVGPPRLGAARQIGRFGVAVELIGGAVLLVVQGLVAGVVLLGAGFRGELGPVLAFGVLVLIVGRVRIGFPVLVGLALLVALVELIGEIEGGEEIACQPAKRVLIEQCLRHAVEQGAGAFLDPGAPQIDESTRLGRRREAGQPLAHQKRQRIGQRRLGPFGLRRHAAPRIAVFHAGIEIGGHAFHALGADRLDARLLDGLEHGAGIAARRRQRPVQAVVVAGHGEGGRVRVAADHGDLVLGGNARGLGHAGGLAGEARWLAGEHHLDGSVGGDGAGGQRQRALERIEGRLFPLGRRHGTSSRPRWPSIAADPHRSSADRTRRSGRAPTRRIC